MAISVLFISGKLIAVPGSAAFADHREQKDAAGFRIPKTITV
jgi:hypothetical protein